jgi:cytoskeleton-associated protein 5
MHVLLQNRDEGVRNKAKTLVIEVYRWIGNALKPQLLFLKPVQVSADEVMVENPEIDPA